MTDPVYASGKFYDALVKVKGYETMQITKVAQEVQRSAFPEAYADHEQEGRVLASTLTGHSPGGLGCRLADAGRGGPPATVVKELKAELGMTGQVSGRTVTLTRELGRARLGRRRLGRGQRRSTTAPHGHRRRPHVEPQPGRERLVLAACPHARCRPRPSWLRLA